MRDLSRGDRGKEVLDVQTRLLGQRFELGREGVDGFFGPHTETAVLSFQQERGLLADGRVGANTWRELVESGYALGDRLLYLREPPFRGDDVLQLQVKLNLLGFNAGPERGVHDEEVERAVLDFQRNAGLPLDGIVGESTLNKLEAVRKAESGREGKKIPERDRGYAAALSLTGQSVTIDPGHGGADLGVVSPRGLAEKDVTLALGLRLAELLRAEGCRVQLTREAGRARAALRARRRGRRRAPPTSSSRCTATTPPRRRPRRRGLLLPAQPLLLGARAPAGGRPSAPAWSAPACPGWAGSGATTRSCARRAASPWSSSRSSSPAPKTRRWRGGRSTWRSWRARWPAVSPTTSRASRCEHEEAS